MGKATWNRRIGIIRSVLIYYWKPFVRRRLKRFYRQFVKEGDLCFDIGAHLGNRTRAFLDLGASVISVDPQPACVDYLQKKFGKHPDVTLLPIAVGSEPGELDFHVSHRTPTISTMAGADWQAAMQEKGSYKITWDYSFPVEVVTLDQLIAKYGIPAFCKIDVEDFEYQTLLGLSQPLPCLSFEYFTPTIDRALKCIDRLEEIGTYRYNWSFVETQKMQSQIWIDANTMRQILESYTDDDPSGDIYARLSQK